MLIPSRRIRGSLLALLLCVIFISGYKHEKNQGSMHQRFPISDNRFLKPFLNDRTPNLEEFVGLVTYFQDGFIAYKEAQGSFANFPGLPSNHPTVADRIEGFSRIAPLLAVWLRTTASSNDPQTQRVSQLLSDGLIHGTDPTSCAYWGRFRMSDQRIVEASDVALTVWLLRNRLWLQLPGRIHDNVVRWLLQVNDKNIPDNNWHLFVTFVNVVVNSLGHQADMAGAQRHYARFRQFYRGNGWFSDGPGMQFDYYNAWGIHYQLFWIDQVDPTFDHSFIATALDQFASRFQYFIGPDGIPILGRSICYRMAVPTPLILDQNLPNPSVPPGVARRALDATWRYFIRNGAVSDGNIAQGYCSEDARVLDNYSGPASCLWGLRSLISALYLAPSTAFWAEQEQPLPVEQANYVMPIPPTRWTVYGTKPNLIVVNQKGGLAPVPLRPENWLLAYFDRLTNSAHRPANELPKYELSEYRSDRPFCDCVKLK